MAARAGRLMAALLLLASIAVVVDLSPGEAVFACSCGDAPSPAEFVRLPGVTSFVGVASNPVPQVDGSTRYTVSVSEALSGPIGATVSVVGAADSGDGAMCGGPAVTLTVDVPTGFMLEPPDESGAFTIPSGLCHPSYTTSNLAALRLIVSGLLPPPDGAGPARGLTHLDNVGTVALLDARARVLAYLGGFSEARYPLECPGGRLLRYTSQQLRPEAGLIYDTTLRTFDLATLSLYDDPAPSQFEEISITSVRCVNHDGTLFGQAIGAGNADDRRYFLVSGASAQVYSAPADMRGPIPILGFGLMLWESFDTFDWYTAPIGSTEVVAVGAGLEFFQVVDDHTVVFFDAVNPSIVEVDFSDMSRRTTTVVPPKPGLELGRAYDGTSRLAFRDASGEALYLVGLDGTVSGYTALPEGVSTYGAGDIGTDPATGRSVFIDADGATPILPWNVLGPPSVFAISEGGPALRAVCSIEPASPWTCPPIELPEVL